LIGALDDLGALIAVLKGMAAAIKAVADKNAQKKSPASFQLLSNPELLNWSC
jgi:hypothetical protein